MAISKHEWNEAIKNLPESLRDALESVETADAIQAIAKKLGLHIDQMGKLTDEVTLVMIGKLHPSQFVQHIQESLSVDEATSFTIAQEVNKQIFLKIRESLKTIHEIGEKHSHKEALEGKNDLLQAIESPENIPMRARVIEVAAVQVKKEPVIIEATPALEPAPVPVPPAEKTESVPLAPASSPIEQKTSPSPEKKPAPAPRAPGPDPYREAPLP